MKRQWSENETNAITEHGIFTVLKLLRAYKNAVLKTFLVLDFGLRSIALKTHITSPRFVWFRLSQDTIVKDKIQSRLSKTDPHNIGKVSCQNLYNQLLMMFMTRLKTWLRSNEADKPFYVLRSGTSLHPRLIKTFFALV